MVQANRFSLAGIAFVGLGTGIASISGTSLAPARATVNQASAGGPGAQQCSAFEGRQIGGATIDKAEYLPKGSGTISPAIKAASDICRLSGHISPVAGSDIKIHVWLPANWNGKLLGVGGAGFNGGFAMEWFVLTGPLSRGYAGVSTDAGHDAADGAEWAFHHPEKIVDFGYRANHLGTVAAKAIVASYYRRPATKAYFHGCSNGGRDALMLAQRYPQDYDGIVAGAPANSWTALLSSFARNGQVMRPVRNSIGPKLKLVHDAVLKQCDAADGANDGLIGNPAKCRFDPAVLECKAATGPSCLSKAEVSAVRAIYRGTRTRDGRLIMPGFSPGSELEWSSWFAKADGQAPAMAQDFYRYMIYGDPKWDWTRFVLDRDYPIAMRRAAPILDATDADLRPFARYGGKLLMYHGWADPAIPPRSSIRYFEAARGALGARADDIRLFMVPGMGHCFGGGLKMVSALDKWVESGKPPERLISRKYEDFKLGLLGLPTKIVQTRPICAWPKTPYYKGKGPMNQESSFVCR